MATAIFVSAFVWFFMLAPTEPGLVEPYAYHNISKAEKPRAKSVTQSTQKSSSKMVNKLEAYIIKQNPFLPKNEVQEIAFWINEYAQKEDMDPMLVAALISRESSFKKDAVSSTGAKGLGQIKDFNFKDLDIKDPFNIQQNVRGTVKYLKHLFNVWEDSNNATELALASYLQGPNATKKKKNNISKKVTNYVDDILSSYQSLKSKVKN